MFLGGLKEEEKQLFWELANYLVLVDGKVAEDETRMLEEYKCEMGGNDLVIGKPDKTLAKILEHGHDMDKRIKKILFFELIGLAISDERYDYSEKSCIKEVRDYFGISEADEKAMQSIIERIIETYQELGTVLNA